jgi:hypothetical protein
MKLFRDFMQLPPTAESKKGISDTIELVNAYLYYAPGTNSDG